VNLTLKPFPKAAQLIFAGSKAPSVVITAIDNTKIDLPLRFFLVDGRLTVPANASLTLQFQPEKTDLPPVTTESKSNKEIAVEKQPVTESWDLRIETPEWDRFTEIVSPTDQSDPSHMNWLAADAQVRGEFWMGFNGPLPIWRNLKIDTPTGEQSLPVIFTTNWVESGAPVGSRVLDFVSFQEPWLQIQPQIETETIGIDIQVPGSTQSLNLGNMVWWDKDGQLPLAGMGESMVVDSKEQKVYLFRNQKEPMQWTFTLPDTPFMMARQITLPSPLPPFCRMALTINGQTMELPQNATVWNIPEKAAFVKSLTLTVSSWGNEPALTVSLPVIGVMGIRRTPYLDMSRVGVQLDGNAVALKLTKIPEGKGEWMRVADLNLTTGVHEIGVTDSQYFRIKKLKLHTDDPAPWPDKSAVIPPSSSIWGRLIGLGIKLVLLAGVGYGVYVFRRPIRSGWNRVSRPIRYQTTHYYGLLSDGRWAVVWLLITCGLYGRGMIKSPSTGENYALTFGGITMVFCLWHIGRWCRTWLTEKFPQLAEIKSAPFSAA